MQNCRMSFHWTNNPVSPSNRQHGITKVRRKVIEKKKDSKNNGIWIVIQTVKRLGQVEKFGSELVLAAIKVLGPTLSNVRMT